MQGVIDYLQAEFDLMNRKRKCTHADFAAHISLDRHVYRKLMTGEARLQKATAVRMILALDLDFEDAEMFCKELGLKLHDLHPYYIKVPKDYVTQIHLSRPVTSKIRCGNKFTILELHEGVNFIDTFECNKARAARRPVFYLHPESLQDPE